MDIKITPNKLHGSIAVPPSKSISHRALICAALAGGRSEISNLLACSDITATTNALNKLGADIKDGNVNGITNAAKAASIDCIESGSTLRFLIPIAAALGVSATFDGGGKLPERPITPYITELSKHGITFHSKEMPYSISGKLTGGHYSIAGDISSQFITGLLFALPLLAEDSKITLTSPLQSKPYVDITIDCMKKFGVSVFETDDGYLIHGNQRYKPSDYSVEADMSQAAFFLVADKIGGDISVSNLNPDSLQGDKAILDITDAFDKSKPLDINAEQIPDIVPILAVLCTFADGVSYIRSCARLRIKECDRLEAIATELNRLGARIETVGDDLKITGVDALDGGVCNSRNDHRIAMSLAVASQRCTAPLTIIGAECVGKSYPDFWTDFTHLGGVYNVVNN